MLHPDRSIFYFISQMFGQVKHVADDVNVPDFLSYLVDSLCVNALWPLSSLIVYTR